MRGQTCIEGCIEQLSRLFMFGFFLEKHKYTTVRRLKTDRRTRKRRWLGGVLYFRVYCSKMKVTKFRRGFSLGDWRPHQSVSKACLRFALINPATNASLFNYFAGVIHCSRLVLPRNFGAFPPHVL